ncbi:hypothetical protein, partial [Streptomyces sp. NPDC049906]|uniref:hypothetical protein n=1 Tax=Streptomyces sp. NPDC049906 TaxID=3155656 RepID=UPI00343E25D5
VMAAVALLLLVAGVWASWRRPCGSTRHCRARAVSPSRTAAGSFGWLRPALPRVVSVRRS